jgi:aromatic-L-amino-acid/L-tryptophan decarboxylase
LGRRGWAGFAVWYAGGDASGRHEWSPRILVCRGKVNLQVIEWIKEFLGFPKEAGGVLTSGGSEANFTGLAVARNAKAEGDVKADGVQGLKHKMTLYCGDETHRCLERSVELLGLGNKALRNIPTDETAK